MPCKNANERLFLTLIIVTEVLNFGEKNEITPIVLIFRPYVHQKNCRVMLYADSRTERRLNRLTLLSAL